MSRPVPICSNFIHGGWVYQHEKSPHGGRYLYRHEAVRPATLLERLLWWLFKAEPKVENEDV